MTLRDTATPRPADDWSPSRAAPRSRGQETTARRPPAEVDDDDLMRAMRELEAGRVALREAHAIVDRREKREAIAAATARLGLGRRWLGAVIDRRG